MFIFLSIILLFLILSVISFLFIAQHILNTPANNNPDAFLKNKALANKKVLLTLGDSITHGVVSANYSNLIRDFMEQYHYQTINAGMNADLAITALRKIDKVIACKPDIVTILLGTNDVMASESDADRKRYVSIKRLNNDAAVSIEAYAESLTTTVQALKAASIKNIFLISLPLIGEDLSQAINQKTLAYSQVIKDIADKESVNYVPLNESMREVVATLENVRGFNKGSQVKINYLIAQHYFFKKNLDKLFKDFAYQFLTEGVHLNRRGAELTSSLVIKAFEEHGLLD